MVTMKRFAVLLITAMALPLLVFGEAMAGGGFFPTIPANFVLKPSKEVTATIALDPNGPLSAPSTPTGTFGAISISRKHYNPATAVFRVEVDSSLGELAKGCDLGQTNVRFVNVNVGQPGLPLGSPGSENWLASGLTTTLFSQLGVALQDPSLSVLLIPGITGVISQQCAPFPPSYPNPSGHSGFLILEVTIGFWAAPGTPTPK
jgi:hypothetical protein